MIIIVIIIINENHKKTNRGLTAMFSAPALLHSASLSIISATALALLSKTEMPRNTLRGGCFDRKGRKSDMYLFVAIFNKDYKTNLFYK